MDWSPCKSVSRLVRSLPCGDVTSHLLHEAGHQDLVHIVAIGVADVAPPPSLLFESKGLIEANGTVVIRKYLEANLFDARMLFCLGQQCLEQCPADALTVPTALDAHAKQAVVLYTLAGAAAKVEETDDLSRDNSYQQ
jgi:hypothetical protein